MTTYAGMRQGLTAEISAFRHLHHQAVAGLRRQFLQRPWLNIAEIIIVARFTVDRARGVKTGCVISVIK